MIPRTIKRSMSQSSRRLAFGHPQWETGSAPLQFASLSLPRRFVQGPLHRRQQILQHRPRSLTHVQVRGVDTTDARVDRLWYLVAAEGDGPYVPTLAASALVRKLAASHNVAPGAHPCVGVLTLANFHNEVDGLSITMGVSS